MIPDLYSVWSWAFGLYPSMLELKDCWPCSSSWSTGCKEILREGTIDWCFIWSVWAASDSISSIEISCSDILLALLSSKISWSSLMSWPQSSFYGELVSADLADVAEPKTCCLLALISSYFCLRSSMTLSIFSMSLFFYSSISCSSSILISLLSFWLR